MDKEIIKVSDITSHNYLDGDYNKNWKWIKDWQENFDSEKGFVDIVTIMQRISDGKYFKITHTQFGHNGNNLQEQIAKEVIRTEVITYKYI